VPCVSSSRPTGDGLRRLGSSDPDRPSLPMWGSRPARSGPNRAMGSTDDRHANALYVYVYVYVTAEALPRGRQDPG